VITGIFGDIGSGKSWYQLWYGLRCCQKYQKKLVTNFNLDTLELKKYAARHHLPWVAWLADNNQIAVVDAANNLEDFFRGRSQSVVLIDEAGIFVNSREFQKTPKQLLTDLAQSRKAANDLIYAAQSDIQIDKQFKILTQYFIHANGQTKWDKKLKLPRLVFKNYQHFRGQAYWIWESNPRIRANPFRSWFKADYSTYGFFSPRDAELFRVFDTKARLDEQSAYTKEFATVSPHADIFRYREQLATNRRAAEYRRYLLSLDFYQAAARLEICEFRRWLKLRNQLSKQNS
jgi:hypothetical protein